ncbi:MAG: hypothetical protein Q9218_005871 [Villophora microphyllina]
MSSRYADINGPGGIASVLPGFSSARISSHIAVPITSGPAFYRTNYLKDLQKKQTDKGGPYPVHSRKATLIVDGNLNSMTEEWTPAERTAGRRLVFFSRWQQDDSIYASFEPVIREDYIPNSACISCIRYEKEEGAFWATSVDIINVLEKLAADKFSIEEKNRIRRDIEGFKPVTVSKLGDEDFFNVINGFPEPKPRNIGKDIKAFNWTILAHALEKVIGRFYSRVYYSPTPSNSLQLTSPPRSTDNKVYAPISRPREHADSSTDTHNTDYRDQQYYSSSPHSSTYSTHSSTYTNTGSYRSSTTSPNISHAPRYEHRTLQPEPMMYPAYHNYATRAVEGEDKYESNESSLGQQSAGGLWVHLSSCMETVDDDARAGAVNGRASAMRT